jgi:hypothetical protein
MCFLPFVITAEPGLGINVNYQRNQLNLIPDYYFIEVPTPENQYSNIFA